MHFKPKPITICVLLLLLFSASEYGLAQDGNFWDERKVELDEQDALTPVVVAVWDTGVDISVFEERNIWGNPREKLDGKDTDGNGYVDDLHGIAFDIKENPTTNLLMPKPDGMSEEGMVQLALSNKGNRDALYGVDSDEAKAAFKDAADSSREANRIAAEQLTWFGEYAHGTSMADICARGNPFIRIMTIRQQFSHQPPVPSIDGYKRRAKAYKAAVQYMKANSVRVSNLSWSRWPEFFDKIQRQHETVRSKEQRKLLAKQLYEIERDALLSAIKDAPEILFVTSSRNMSNFSKGGALPQSLDLPNIISAGAADVNGKRLLTPRNADVDVFAFAKQVKAKTPGGIETLTMGTSVASAQVTNLAAKLLAMNPELTPVDLKSIIVDSSTPSIKRSSVLLVHPKNAISASKDAGSN